MLCSETNRFHLPGSPSTCALDTGITPIPSFILLGFLAIYVPARLVLAHRATFSGSLSSDTGLSKTKSQTSSRSDADTYTSGYTYPSPSESPPRAFNHNNERGLILPKWVHWTYVVLLVCLFGLRVLEVVRLVMAKMGVGLLPVGIVANVAIVGMLVYGGLGLGMGTRRSILVSTSLVLYWAVSTILESVKVARLSSYNSLHPAKGIAYPSSDWLLDNGCMLGLLVIFFFFEGSYLILRWRSSFLPPSPSESARRRERQKKNISKPRLMPEYEYDPVVYLNDRSSGAVI